MTIDVREAEQRRVEELFSQSVLSYEERRQEQYVRSWIAFHERQRKSHEATLGGLAAYHRGEEDRYRQLLNGISTTEGAEQHD